jgi:hypothetical protein
MLEHETLKIKKSKKDKKQKKEERHQLDFAQASDAEEVVQVDPKKEKKDKKRKRDSMLEDEPVELSVESSIATESDKKKHKKDKKRKRQEVPDEELMLVEDCMENTDLTEPQKKKKNKKAKKDSLISESEDVPEKREIIPETPKKKNAYPAREEHFEEKPIGNDTTVSISTPMGSQEYDENTGGAKYWRRIDVDKYQNVVTGTKFEDNSHYAKGGDSWGDDAADRLGKVKGKGFKKEMQKLKRASWKGCGSIDTGVNSVQFSDWEE